MLWVAGKTVLEWTGKIDLIRTSLGAFAAWAVDLYGALSAPSHRSTVVIFSLSVSLVGMLVFIEKRKGRLWRSACQASREENVGGRLEAEKIATSMASTVAISYQQVKEEWEQLEEGEREIIREIVLKGGLMESDITAILKARGFVQYDVTYEPITDRISFIQCDYTGYHSIVPACRSWLSQKIQEEMRDESFSNEIR